MTRSAAAGPPEKLPSGRRLSEGSDGLSVFAEICRLGRLLHHHCKGPSAADRLQAISKKRLVTSASLLVARTLLIPPGLTTSNKDATSNKVRRY